MTADDLERRAIIAAHDAHCVRAACGEDPLKFRRLTTSEKAIVEALRGDLADKSAEVDDKSRVGHAAADAWMDRAHQAEAAIERVRTLHERVGSDSQRGFCGFDSYSWPCPTIRALDGTEATDD